MSETKKEVQPAEPVLYLLPDPSSPVERHASQVKLSKKFLKRMFLNICPFWKEADELQRDFELCQNIISSQHPSVFIRQSTHELNREDYRLLTFNQSTLYHREAMKLLSMEKALKNLKYYLAY